LRTGPGQVLIIVSSHHDLMGLAVYHPTSITRPRIYQQWANEESACWLTPSALDGQMQERIQERAPRTRTRTRPHLYSPFWRGRTWEGFRASACRFLCPLLRPKSDYLLSLCINSLPCLETVCVQKKPDLRVKLRALTVTALVWSTDPPLRTMLIGFISPMEVLSIERIYVHL
jgi:hypothetical protein